MKNALFKTLTQIPRGLAVCGAILAAPAAFGQSSATVSNAVGSFLATGSASNPSGANLEDLNFGGAGTFAIAPTSSTKGGFDSVLMFNTASAVSQFNSEYGAGNWTITGITLSLASNFGAQGDKPTAGIFNTINAGSFGIDWLANNSWVVGSGGGSGGTGYPNNTSVSWDDIPNLMEPGYDSLGTFSYTPPGENTYATYTLPLDGNLVDSAAAGGAVSLFFYAADNQVSYLFNSDVYSINHPEFTLVATPTPEPGTVALLAAGLGGFLLARRQKKTP